MLLVVDFFHALEKINKKYNLKFTLRAGVHVGPVVAGVLGLKRFTYDVWGDSGKQKFALDLILRHL